VNLPAALHRPNGAFVTLLVAGELNGCIGDVAGSASLAVSVADLAIKAAFHDPRLPALTSSDLAGLTIEVSLLSSRIEVPAGSRTELLQQLRRDEHGLTIRSGSRRALFLPSVWRQLPRPDQFVDQLLRKAGLPHGAWPDDLVAAVFTTTTVSRHLA
jgi:AmmeMemoRadiSam system protein A